VKQNIFKTLDQISTEGTILASNTSSISITKIASFTKRPENVIGMHFMNPVPVMKLVEVINGLRTSESTYRTTISLVQKVQKEYAVSKDIPGFIANRILMPYINEAIFTLYEGIGTMEDIDKTMKLGTNVPMGPFTLADFIGLDTYIVLILVCFTS
jgi:3-hydroxybutyryl-CoA dehydrogenase